MKARDVVEIFRQQRRRAAQGKSSVAYINGQLVEPERIRQYLHRASPKVADEIYRIATSDVDDACDGAGSASGNSVVCRTPSPPPRTLHDPPDLRIPHECLLILRSYVSSGYESGLWELEANHARWESSASPSWLGLVVLAADIVKTGNTGLGFRLLGISFDYLKVHLRRLDTAFLPITILAAMYLGNNSEDLANIFLDYITQLTSVVLSPGHVLTVLWQRLRQLRHAGLKQYGPAITRAYMDAWHKYTKGHPFHSTSSGRWLQALLQWSQLVSYSYLAELPHTAYHQQQQLSCDVLSHLPTQQQHAYDEAAATQQLGRALALPGTLGADTDKMLAPIAAWLDSRPANATPHARFDFYCVRFHVLRRPGLTTVANAIAAGRDLVDFCVAAYGPTHRRTARALFLLEQFLEERGERAALRRLRAEFEGFWDALCDDLCRSVASYVLDAEKHKLEVLPGDVDDVEAADEEFVR
jgi:hypothetical protein